MKSATQRKNNGYFVDGLKKIPPKTKKIMV
jgi:hypothetical protein